MKALTGLGHDDVVRLEELAHTWPKVLLGYDVILLLGHWKLKLGDLELERALLERLQAVRELRQEALHADTREARKLHARVVRVKLYTTNPLRPCSSNISPQTTNLDRPAGGDTVGEVTCVEVALQTSD